MSMLELHGIELVARAVIVHDDRILLCRAQGKGHYFFPGGHIEFGETAEACLVRELKEETGLDLHVGDYMGSAENFFVQDGQKRHEYSFVFVGSLAQSEVRSREDHISFAWLPLTEMSATHILPAGLKESVAEWLHDKKIFWSSQIQK